MSNQQTFTELFNEVHSDLSFGWKELLISNKDIKHFTWVNAFEMMKFSVEIEYNDKVMETTVYKEYNSPDLEDVFKDLVSYARATNKTTFPEFCENNGYDSDSIKVLNFYKYCKKEKKKLLQLMGDDLFQKFMECDFD